MDDQVGTTWDHHKDTLRKLYTVENWTLQRIMGHMQDEFRFTRNKAQYERQFKKWGLRKYATSEAWKEIHCKIDKRKKQGKSTSVYQGGRLVETKKLGKEKRHSMLTNAYAQVPGASPKTPEGFTYCTPPGNDPPSIFLSNLSSLLLFRKFKLSEIHSRATAKHSEHMPITRGLHDVDVVSPSPKRSDSQTTAVKAPGIWTNHSRSIETFQTLLTTTTVDEDSLPLLRGIFLATNNLIEVYHASELYGSICRIRHQKWLHHLFSEQSPVTQAIVRILLPAAIASSDLTLVKGLLLSGIDANAPVNYAGDTPLRLALIAKDVAVTKLLLEYRADVHKRTPSGGLRSYMQSPLETAILVNSLELTKLLLRSGANANDRTRTTSTVGQFGPTALRSAIQAVRQSEDLSIVRALLEHGADVNDNTNMCYEPTVLLLAASAGLPKTVELLLSHGADVNALSCQCTALQAAAASGSLRVVTLLVDAGASDLREAAEIAASKGRRKIVRFLTGKLVSSDLADHRWHTTIIETVSEQRLKPHRLAKAVLENNTGLTRRLLRSDVDINASLCEVAASWKLPQLDILKLLLDSGADLRIHGNRLLRISIERGSLALVELLLHRSRQHEIDIIQENGDDLAKDPRLWPVLRLAASRSYTRDAHTLIQILVHHGARQTAGVIHCLASRMSIDLILRILELDVDVNERCDVAGKLETALEIAARNKGIGFQLVRLLLDHGAIMTDRTLQAASVTGGIELAQLCIRLGADVNATTLCIDQGSSVSRTALQAAAERGSIDIVRFLLDAGADLEIRGFNEDGSGSSTALQLAAIRGSLDIVEELLVRGADVNASAGGDEGRTALAGAAEHGRLDTVQLLINVQADVRGSRALVLALMEGHGGVATLLREYM